MIFRSSLVLSVTRLQKWTRDLLAVIMRLKGHSNEDLARGPIDKRTNVVGAIDYVLPTGPRTEVRYKFPRFLWSCLDPELRASYQ